MSRKSKRNRQNPGELAPEARSAGRTWIVYAAIAALVLAVVAGSLLYKRGESPAGPGAEQAALALRKLGRLPLHRYPHHPLSERVWQLRNSLSAYDAQYVALAEALDLPLITCDTKLANAHGHRATVETFAR